MGKNRSRGDSRTESSSWPFFGSRLTCPGRRPTPSALPQYRFYDNFANVQKTALTSFWSLWSEILKWQGLIVTFPKDKCNWYFPSRQILSLEHHRRYPHVRAAKYAGFFGTAVKLH